MIIKIGLKKAGLIYIAMNLITIFVHLLVIFQIMPYKWINGGRSATFEIARQTSLRSIPYFIVVTGIILLASEIIQVRWNKVSKKIILILLWIIVAYTCLGMIFQLLGTSFEKAVMSVVCVISILMGIRIALEKRKY